MHTPDVIYKYRNEVIEEMKNVLDEYESPVRDMMRYHLGWMDEEGHPVQIESGKLLRPALCLLACEASGGNYREALPAAAAVELIHNYSLIHDDIQDDDRERHHRPTVWTIWGKPQAINAGTAMRVLANQALFHLDGLQSNLGKIVKMQQLIDSCTLQLIAGQYLDISFENRLDITTGDYLRMVQGKTSALIACALELGAMLGCEQQNVVQSFKSAGICLGLAFQIADDILGIWGNPEVMGKPNGSDIRKKKKSFPVVFALEKTIGYAQIELKRIYQAEVVDDRAVWTVLDILERSGARGYAQQVALEYLGRAKRELEEVGLAAPGKEDLEALMDFLVDRDF